MKRPSFCILLTCLMLATGFAARAQQGDATPPVTDSVRIIPAKPPVAVKRPPRPKPLNREWAGGFLAYTNGWSGVIEKGMTRTEETGEKADLFYNARSFSLEFATRKDPREEKLSDRRDPNSKGSFIFGKINSFYTVNLGMNFRKMIAGKPEPKTISIHWTYGGGAAIGLLKPYYLIAYNPKDGSVGPMKYSPETASSFLNEQYIQGPASFSEGLSEIKILPGVHARTGLRFDFAATKKRLLALETGVSAAYYMKPVEIMAGDKSSPFLLNLYAGLFFGKRYAGKQP